MIKKRDLKWRYWLFLRKTPKYDKELNSSKTSFYRSFNLFINILVINNAVIPKYLKDSFIYIRFMMSGCDIFVKKIYKKILKQAKYFLKILFVFFPTSNIRNKEKKNKIVIIGGYGWLDIGDEAMPRTDLINIRKKMPDVDIVMLSPSPKDTTAYHKERSIYDLNGVNWLDGNYKARVKGFVKFLIIIIGAIFQRINIRLRLFNDIRAILDEFVTSKILFNVGGGNLNSIMVNELSKKGTLYIVAKILGLKIILSGQTIGPFYRKIDASFARRILNLPNLITLRDKEISIERLKSIGVTRPEIISTADDAIDLPSITEEEAKKIISDTDNKGWGKIFCDYVIGLNMKASLSCFSGLNNISLDESNTKLAKLINYLLESYNCKIILIPTDFSNSTDDRVCHRQIYEQVEKRERVLNIDIELDDKSLKGIIALCNCVIGARYHFCVFAASSYVPFLGIANGLYQKTKLQGLAYLSELPECYIENDLDEIDEKELFKRADWLIENLLFCKEILHKKVPILIKKSQISIDKAVDYLNF